MTGLQAGPQPARHVWLLQSAPGGPPPPRPGSGVRGQGQAQVRVGARSSLPPRAGRREHGVTSAGEVLPVVSAAVEPSGGRGESSHGL